MEENLHTNDVSRGEAFVTYNCTVDQIFIVQRDLSLNLCQNVNTEFVSGA